MCHRVNFILSDVRSYCNNITIQEKSYTAQLWWSGLHCLYSLYLLMVYLTLLSAVYVA